MNIGSKKQLEIVLSKVLGFYEAKVREEQYITPSSIAAEVLWKAYFNGDIEKKTIADFGAGTGVLGIGCLLLGAKNVFFVERDAEAMRICQINVAKVKSEYSGLGEPLFALSDLRNFEIKVDTIITNPPFGTKVRHADKEFLLKAFTAADKVYSFHKSSTSEFVVELAKKNCFILDEKFNFSFMLKNTMKHHMKNKPHIEVSCFVLTRHSHSQ